LDAALVLWFPAPASFTGEDMAELHLHGGRAVVARVLAALGRCEGLRLATPGEFTRRAFDAGKLDLTEVEGLADLVAAETEAQARQALRQLSGELGRLYEGWRARLVRALAHAEAEIDFPDEDLPAGLTATLRPELAALIRHIEAHLADERRGERLRDGVSIAIIGPPNAGKSSLLNALARREAAIVSTIAGTTRDVIEVHLDLGGYPAIVADTAGLRAMAASPGDDQAAIEGEGMRRALARADTADLKLLVLDASTRGDETPLDPGLARLVDRRTFVIVNKIDLAPGTTQGRHWRISVKTGQGVAELVAALSAEVAALLRVEDSTPPVLTRARHRESLEACLAALRRAVQAEAAELFAEDLRLAVRALGRITGRVSVDDILDVVFREFCLGK
ncbi:MAG TPA: tRNA uridine-5-carboxymethylaminomethyl(34) synthesis GTPase MnmE, partial [Alphaproteobacteria bacterium]|nr:tRNA uridine-5-carboxymethylaminomethyl(34) synthesis GTPase MnmE [Alphaproteobacteria bacterium]